MRARSEARTAIGGAQRNPGRRAGPRRAATRAAWALLAAGTLAAAPAAGEEGPAVDPAALAAQLDTADANERDRVIEELQRQGGRAVPALVAALKSPSSRVVAHAAQTLGLIGDAAARDGLLGACETKEWFARWNVVWALGRFRDERAATALLTAAQDENAWVRAKAVMGLGAQRDPRAAPVLSAALTDEYYGVRRMAAEAAGWLCDDRTLPALRAALGDDNWNVRWEALNALERLADGASLARMTQVATNDRVDSVQAKAQSVTRNLRGDEPLAALIRDLKSDDLNWRLFVITRLGRLGKKAAESGATAALAELAQAPRRAETPRETERETLTRWRAAWALGQLQDAAAVGALAALLADPEYIVRYQAVLALQAVGTDAARAALAPARKDVNALVAEAAR